MEIEIRASMGLSIARHTILKSISTPLTVNHFRVVTKVMFLNLTKCGDS